jgi:hypothetical protein
LIETNTRVNEIRDDMKGDDIELIFDITKTIVLYDGVFHLNINNNTLIYTPERKDLILRHKFDIVQDMKFENTGLDSFEKIWEKVESCKNLNFKTCFRLDNFDAEFENVAVSDTNFIKIKLTSKEEVYIDNELEKIEFSFLVKT